MAARKKLKARVVKVAGYKATRYKRNPGSDDLYDALRAAGCELDSHESDLYVKATPQAREIISRYKWAKPSAFTANDGSRWIELPFCYSPFWRGREQVAQRRSSARGNPRRRHEGVREHEWFNMDRAERNIDGSDGVARALAQHLDGNMDESVGGLEEAGWFADLYLDVPTIRNGRRGMRNFILRHDEQGFDDVVAETSSKASVMREWREIEKEASEAMADRDYEER